MTMGMCRQRQQSTCDAIVVDDDVVVEVVAEVTVLDRECVAIVLIDESVRHRVRC